MAYGFWVCITSSRRSLITTSPIIKVVRLDYPVLHSYFSTRHGHDGEGLPRLQQGPGPESNVRRRGNRKLPRPQTTEDAKGWWRRPVSTDFTTIYNIKLSHDLALQRRIFCTFITHRTSLYSYYPKFRYHCLDMMKNVS